MKIKYPGRLGTPVPRSASIAALDSANKSGDLSAYIKWKDGQRKEVLALLFSFYGIDSARADSWEQLAIALADDHVPGLRINTILHPMVGRPRKEPKPRRDKGRPQKWTELQYLSLYTNVNAYVSSHSLRGRNAVKTAIEQILRTDARRKGSSELRALKRTGYFQRRYSEAASNFGRSDAEILAAVEASHFREVA